LKEFAIKVNTGTCRILVGESLRDLGRYLPEGKKIVVTDPNVRELYGNMFSDFACIEIGQGEKNKTLKTIEKIYRDFLDLEVDRSSFIIGIGGGIVCDVAGYAASTYMRGLSFGFVPTTLLAQVDASIGGKNGVNFLGFKNIVGTFRQPQFVLCDPAVLPTLPPREIMCGSAEIVKHALIKSAGLFEFLENHWQSLLDLEREAVLRTVNDSVAIKTEVVQADSEEAGERRLLNFGHTLGHALEREEGLSHGEAVSLGMVLATRISASRGMISKKSMVRIVTLLRNMGLPTESSADWKLILANIRKDKKRQGDGIHFVFLSEIGRAEDAVITYEELEKYVKNMC